VRRQNIQIQQEDATTPRSLLAIRFTLKRADAKMLRRKLQLWKTKLALPPVPAAVAFIQDSAVRPQLASSAAYLSFMSTYFSDKVLILHSIRQKIAEKLSVAAHQIYVCGSAQFGYSYVKDRAFQEKISDLDMAIISPQLFAKYYDAATNATEAFSDQRKFSDPEQRDQFFQYISKKGMLRPDLLPRCYERQNWEMIFNQISSTYRDRFRVISGAIYISETAFSFKQVPCIEGARGK
jgi:hypothetical protein